MYRSLFADLMPSLWGIEVPALALHPVPEAAGDLARFAGVYAWPDRRLTVEVSNTAINTGSGSGLRITSDRGVRDVVGVGERTFLVDASDPDRPTVTFGADGVDGKPEVLYEMLWGLPRVVEPDPG